jgi:hypothetical protein
MSRIAGIVIAVLIFALSASVTRDRAEAGASASAPSRYSQASSAGYQTWTRWLRGTRGGTSEYSSGNRRR